MEGVGPIIDGLGHQGLVFIEQEIIFFEAMIGGCNLLGVGNLPGNRPFIVVMGSLVFPIRIFHRIGYVGIAYRSLFHYRDDLKYG
uniref:Uncharacterized protein n=1 Tax=Candidatus Kentrum sp. LPFa TaxID=2126335 RepID=A0A450VPT9_9GAMM|nr:MAG: hypothetical protein BECKLPF1236A_GA0070988_1000440 [Candidatus Kentron sp. LPFa]VFK33219.1 MAG: hypothetical protein BECKLPF1236C_GA0070990_101974 [Candidatus Kentron sp. LPFa]